ncbi:MAG: DoxX family protein [Candidatus Dadabacteria bacterium]|nr:DoxX family protein [Candidatus Dadabacteria bacterium]
MGSLIKTNTALLSVSVLLLRIALGGILFLAGAGKALGWFGGVGMEATLDGFSQMNMGPPLAYLSTYAEFIGGFLIVIGLFTRPAALALTINMLVATIVSLPQGFMMGASYPFSLFMVSLAVLISGPMSISADALLFGKSPAVE